MSGFTEWNFIAFLVFQALARNNRYELMLDLKIDHSSFKYLQKDWKKSNIKGTVKAYSPKSANDNAAEAILMDMEQIYKICVLLRHFRKEHSIILFK